MEVLITDLKRMAQKFLSDDRLTELEVYQCLSSHNGGNYMANIDIAGLEFNVILSYSNIVNYIEKNYPTRIAKFWGEEYTLPFLQARVSVNVQADISGFGK